MRIATLDFEGKSQCGVSKDSAVWKLPNVAVYPQVRSVRSLIENETNIDDLWNDGVPLDVSDRLQPPLRSMEKIFCVGKNFADHASEMGSDPPKLPVIFNKLPSALIGRGDPIVLPEISQKVDFEAELVVVIGCEARDVQRRNAMDCVFGYTIGNDVTARDWQKGRPGGQWLLGKTFDTFAPLGPWIVTADEIPDPQNLDIQLKLNGKVMQTGNTRNMIFPIDYLISHLSKFVTLRPGDLVFTGTPAGVGAGRTPEVYLRAGDEIEIEISTIGKLWNPVTHRPQMS